MVYTYHPGLCLDAATGSEIDLCIWCRWSRNRSSLRHSRNHSDGNSEVKNTFNNSKRPATKLKLKSRCSLFCVCVWNRLWGINKRMHVTSWGSGWFCVKGKPHLLLLEILHPAYECQIETDSEAVLEEEGGSATVELSFGDDGDAVTQQVGLVHVVSGQNHCPACARIQLLI